MRYFYICSDKLIHRLRIIMEENIFNSLLGIAEKGFTQGLMWNKHRIRWGRQDENVGSGDKESIRQRGQNLQRGWAYTATVQRKLQIAQNAFTMKCKDKGDQGKGLRLARQTETGFTGLYVMLESHPMMRKYGAFRRLCLLDRSLYAV